MFSSQKNGLNFSVTICQFSSSSFELCKLLLDFAWYSSCKTFRQWLILFCTSYTVNGQCSKENWLYFLMKSRHHSEHKLKSVVQHLLKGAAFWLNKNQLACLLPIQIYAEGQSIFSLPVQRRIRTDHGSQRLSVGEQKRCQHHPLGF